MNLSKTVEETQEMLGCKRRNVFRLLRTGVLERAEPIHTGESGRPETRITTESIVSYIGGGKNNERMGNE